MTLPRSAPREPAADLVLVWDGGPLRQEWPACEDKTLWPDIRWAIGECCTGAKRGEASRLRRPKAEAALRESKRRQRRAKELVCAHMKGAA
jgi:hypothetical protein